MRVLELRAILPLTIDEFKRGYRYCEIEAMKAENGGGAGVEIVLDEEFTNGRRCTFVPSLNSGFHRRFLHVTYPKLPWIIKKLFKPEQTEIVEEIYNYGTCAEAEFRSDYLASSVTFRCDTLIVEKDDGNQENIFNLNKKELEKRQLHRIDVCNNAYRNHGESTDPVSAMNEVGRRNWQGGPAVGNYNGPYVVFYRVFRFEWKKALIGSIGEAILAKILVGVIGRVLRRLLVDYKSYQNLSEQQLRAYELETGGKVLRELRMSGGIKGTVYDDKGNAKSSSRSSAKSNSGDNIRGLA